MGSKWKPIAPDFALVVESVDRRDSHTPDRRQGTEHIGRIDDGEKHVWGPAEKLGVIIIASNDLDKLADEVSFADDRTGRELRRIAQTLRDALT